MGQSLCLLLVEIERQTSRGRWRSSGFGFCFVAGRTTSHTAKKSIGKLWPVVNDAPAIAHLCNSSGKIAPLLGLDHFCGAERVKCPSGKPTKPNSRGVDSTKVGTFGGVPRWAFPQVGGLPVGGARQTFSP